MINSKPFFTIIIPALNEEVALPNLLGDLAKQTFTDFEVIVVDGHSDDKTVEKTKAFEKKFNKLQVVTSNKRNVSYQRNMGAKNANTDWVVFLDADNRIPEYFLQGIKFQIDMHKPDILATWLKPDTENRTDKSIALLINILVDTQKSTKNPYVMESMMVIRKKAFLKMGGFNEDIHWGEGQDLLRKARRFRYKFHFAREPKYQWSFRRFRKKGIYKSIGNSTLLGIATLLHVKLPKERKAKLYPLEGGQYFEFDPKHEPMIEKIFQKIFQGDNGSSKEKIGRKSFFQKLKDRLF